MPKDFEEFDSLLSEATGLGQIFDLSASHGLVDKLPSLLVSSDKKMRAKKILSSLDAQGFALATGEKEMITNAALLPLDLNPDDLAMFRQLIDQGYGFVKKATPQSTQSDVPQENPPPQRVPPADFSKVHIPQKPVKQQIVPIKKDSSWKKWALIGGAVVAVGAVIYFVARKKESK